MRQWWVVLIPGILSLVSTIAHGANLPTWVPTIVLGEKTLWCRQEHRYLDAPATSVPAERGPTSQESRT